MLLTGSAPSSSRTSSGPRPARHLGCCPRKSLHSKPTFPAVPAHFQREDKDRAKARKAAGKQAKPLWQEDGKRRGLLDKYDEEDEQMMEVGLWALLQYGCLDLTAGS